jgi:FolB domain-containing protein
MVFILHIPTISLQVTIGYFEEERQYKKPIEVEILIKYRDLPKVCFDDDLEDKARVICYKDMVEKMKTFVEKNSFYTVEKWCYEMFSFLLKEMKIESKCRFFSLKFTKSYVPLEEVNNGVSFIYEKEFE